MRARVANTVDANAAAGSRATGDRFAGCMNIGLRLRILIKVGYCHLIGMIRIDGGGIGICRH